MHELSIALSIVDIVTEEAERRGAKVAAVHLKVGPLSGVIPEALTSAWELACDGSPFPGAKLVIEEVPIIVKCPTCNANRPVESLQHLCCSICGTVTPEVVSGRELDLVALEISDEPANAPGGSSPEDIEAK